VDFEDACSSCPLKKWDKMLCTALIGEGAKLKTPPVFVDESKNDDSSTPPSTSTMAKTALQSIAKWTINGVKITDSETLKKRLDTCHQCEFWNSKGFHGTGRCMKCGCSTWAKLRMSTERCPIGKW
jgi:hypothetical protein